MIIATAVTGNEPNNDSHDPAQALSRFYAALNARDLTAMQTNWSSDAEAAMDNPLGGIRRGWTEIGPTYEKLFASEGTFHFEFYEYSVHQTADVFFVIGRERGWLQGRERLELAIRTSRIFRRETSNWKQFHHHGSIERPSMLAAYQTAVLGKTQ
jgi:ketosteroid isomerase-like protein